jgi:DNA-binding transcriptional LysR family regulator
MNDRQLRYALTVWRERSFIRAADTLNIAQSAVSVQVKLLEDELRFQLFRRTGQGAEVTELGRTFLLQAEHAVSYLLGLLDFAHFLRGDSAGTLAIGMSSGIASYVIPLISEALKPELAQTRLEVTTAPTRRIHQLVAEERLDLGLIINTDTRSVPLGHVHQTAVQLKMSLIARPDHRLMRQRRAVDLKELVGEPLIMNELTVGYGELVLSMFADRGMKPIIAAVVDNIETIKIMVRNGMGIAIVPHISIHNEIRLKQLAARSIRSVPDASIVIVSRMHPRASNAERNLEVIKTALQNKASLVNRRAKRTPFSG